MGAGASAAAAEEEDARRAQVRNKLANLDDVTKAEMAFGLPSKLRYCMIDDDSSKPLRGMRQARVSKGGRRHHYPEMNMTVELVEDGEAKQ